MPPSVIAAARELSTSDAEELVSTNSSRGTDWIPILTSTLFLSPGRSCRAAVASHLARPVTLLQANRRGERDEAIRRPCRYAASETRPAQAQTVRGQPL